MKKTTLLILLIVLLLSSKIIIAADTVTVSKKHLVGATFGIQYHNIDDRMLNFKLNGYCGDVFYRHLFSSSTSFFRLPVKLYLSGNAGYTNYEFESIKTEDISAALGVYFYHTSREMPDWYFGVELGALNRKEENIINTNSSDVKLLAAATFGLFIPISESLHLDINLKESYVRKDLKNRKLSAGISYSF